MYSRTVSAAVRTYRIWICRNHCMSVPHCGCHMKISARERIRQLLDEGSFRERDALVESQNEDQFAGYEEKLEKAKTVTGMHEAVICGSGTIMGYASPWQ